MNRWLLFVAAWVVSNTRELIFITGLSLLGWGLALVYVPAAFIVTGAVLVWLAIPPQRPEPGN